MSAALRLPYPGLRSFTRDESDLFFGRDNCVNAMVDRLAATRFLAVLGPSGSGKSSLVRTGLLDALDLGLHPKAPSGWKVAELHPGGQPMRQLACALLQASTGAPADDASIDVLVGFLNQGPRSLQEWISYGNLPPGTNLLVLVDQFEELFRYGDYAQREETEAFVALLLESADSAAGNIHIVITMRSEYLGACASILGLAERISTGLYLTPRMSREECREAIVGPASVLGFTVEPALVNRLLNDLASFAPWESPEDLDLATLLSHQADQLPLMQHVLNRLWIRASSANPGPDPGAAPIVLKLADYDQFGGLSGALDEHGAEVLASLGPSRLRAAENAFRALVSGTSVATAVRRPCRMGELAGLVESAGDSRSDAVAVVEAFRAPGCNFLRTTRASLANDLIIVDISHESLIRQWTPLRQWLEKEVRDGLAWRRLILAEEHYSHHEGGLLTGLDLSNLTAWWESAKPTPTWAERHGGKFDPTQAFLQASQRAEAERTEADQRRERREKARLRFGVAGLATALLFAVAFALIARQAGRTSEAARKSTEAASVKIQSEEKMLATQNAQLAVMNRQAGANLEMAKNAELALKKELGELKAEQQRTASAEQGRAEAEKGKALAETQAAAAQKAQAEAEERLALARQQAAQQVSQISEQGIKRSSGRPGSPIASPRDQSPRAEAENGVDQTASFASSAPNVVISWDVGRTSASSLPVQPETAADEFRRAVAADEAGDALAALKLFSKSYFDYLHLIEARPAAGAPDPAIDAAFIRDGYFYNWFLFDFHQTSEGDQVLKQMEQVANRYDSATAPPSILLAKAKLENIESRGSSNPAQHADHQRNAISLADRSFAADPSLEAMRFLFRFYENYSGNAAVSTSDKEDLKNKACSLADQMYQKDPNYRYSIRARVECLENQSSMAHARKDFAAAESKLKAAHDLIERSLHAKPNNQDLLIAMASVENQIAALWSSQSGDDARKKNNDHQLLAKNYFVRALTDRTRLQGSPTEIRDLYNDFRYVDLPKPEDALAFYRDVARAVEKSVQQLPEVASFTFVLADAANRLEPLEIKEHPPHLEDADRYFTEVKASFPKSGVLNDLANYSEDFDTYCGIYKNQAQIYATLDRANPMLADTKELNDACGPILKNFPYDIYLRFSFIDSAELAGKKLFDLQRYAEARPQLEYASHWGTATSTKLLAKMYQEGWGVPKNEETAKQFDTLASGQTEKRFTIPADFNGTKIQFHFWVRAWPPEYVEKFPGIDDQVKWLKEARGGTVAPEVVESFHKLQKIAQDNKVSFPELCAYTLNENNKETKEKDNAQIAKEFDDARQKCAAQPTVENFAALRTAANAQYQALVKLKKQSDADALEKRLVEDAESLATRFHNPEGYRLAWDTLTDQGEQLKGREQNVAFLAFQRSAELADLLPPDNFDDQYKRFFSDLRVGSFQYDAGKFEEARASYAKGLEAAQKLYSLEPKASNFRYVRIIADDLADSLVKLNRQNEADAIVMSVLQSADTLIAHAPADSDSTDLALVYVDGARRLFASGKPQPAQINLARAEELAGKLTSTTPDGVYNRYRLWNQIAGLLLANGTASDTRAAYLQASTALQSYVVFLTATPPIKANADNSDPFESYGSLSWTYILSGRFNESMQAAQAGLALNPKAAYIEANLAHGLMLTGNTEAARQHYMNVRNQKLGDSNISLLDATKDDFETMKRLGIASPDLYQTMDSILQQMSQK